MIIKHISKAQARAIKTSQDLGDLYAYCERLGDDVAYSFPPSEQERIDALINNINYKGGEYNADNVNRILKGE